MIEKNVKKRYWAFVAYPESLPDNWLDILQATGLPFSLSPLHDKDTNATGDHKKAHYHVILCYQGPTTFNSVKSLTERLNCPIPQPLEAVRGYYRYFTHADNPEKAQYSEYEIRSFNGFDISDFVELTKSEVLKIKIELQSIIRNLQLSEYCDFIDYIQDNLESNFYDVACNNTIFFNSYIKSLKFKKIQENSKTVGDRKDKAL